MFTRPGMAQEGLWKSSQLRELWLGSFAILLDFGGSYISQRSPVVTIGWKIPVVMVMTTGWSGGTPMTKRKPPPEKCSKALLHFIILLHRNSHNGLWYILIYCESWTSPIYIRSSCSLMLDSAAAELWILQTGLHIYIYTVYIYM